MLCIQQKTTKLIKCSPSRILYLRKKAWTIFLLFSDWPTIQGICRPCSIIGHRDLNIVFDCATAAGEFPDSKPGKSWFLLWKPPVCKRLSIFTSKSFKFKAVVLRLHFHAPKNKQKFRHLTSETFFKGFCCLKVFFRPKFFIKIQITWTNKHDVSLWAKKNPACLKI